MSRYRITAASLWPDGAKWKLKCYSKLDIDSASAVVALRVAGQTGPGGNAIKGARPRAVFACTHAYVICHAGASCGVNAAVGQQQQCTPPGTVPLYTVASASTCDKDIRSSEHV